MLGYGLELNLSHETGLKKWCVFMCNPDLNMGAVCGVAVKTMGYCSDCFLSQTFFLVLVPGL